MGSVACWVFPLRVVDRCSRPLGHAFTTSLSRSGNTPRGFALSTLARVAWCWSFAIIYIYIYIFFPSRVLSGFNFYFSRFFCFSGFSLRAYGLRLFSFCCFRLGCIFIACFPSARFPSSLSPVLCRRLVWHSPHLPHYFYALPSCSFASPPICFCPPPSMIYHMGCPAQFAVGSSTASFFNCHVSCRLSSGLPLTSLFHVYTFGLAASSCPPPRQRRGRRVPPPFA